MLTYFIRSYHFCYLLVSCFILCSPLLSVSNRAISVFFPTSPDCLVPPVPLFRIHIVVLCCSLSLLVSISTSVSTVPALVLSFWFSILPFNLPCPGFVCLHWFCVPNLNFCKESRSFYWTYFCQVMNLNPLSGFPVLTIALVSGFTFRWLNFWGRIKK